MFSLYSSGENLDALRINCKERDPHKLLIKWMKVYSPLW